MASKGCEDFRETEFSSVIFDIDPSKSFSREFTGSRQMALQGFPRESITVDYQLNNIPYWDETKGCNLTINFHNNLHLMTRYYCYEIIVKVLVEENGKSYHLPLFTHTETRTKNSITLKDKPLNVNYRFKQLFVKGSDTSRVSSNIKAAHLCFGIRRFIKSSSNKVTKTNSESLRSIVCYCEFHEEAVSSVIVDINSSSHTEDYKGSQRMTLQQYPKESLTLDYEIKSYGYGQNATAYVCSLTLNFDNHLHELSQDYYYEISLKALVSENDKCRHLTLISRTELHRTKETVSLKNEEFQVIDKFSDLLNKIAEGKHIPYAKPHHVCCSIRRYQKSSDNKDAVRKPSLPLAIGEDLLHQNLFSDVCLKVGDRGIQAHRAILALRSSVFREMFSNTETSESITGVVTIDDIEMPVIEEMLRYIYTGHATVGISEFPAKLLKAAHKYDIVGLKAECQEAMMFEMKFANAVELLDLANLYDLKKLKCGVMAFIVKHEEQMVKEPGYEMLLCRELSIDTVVYALKLCAKYHLPKFKAVAFELVKQRTKEIMRDQEYLSLFKSHPDLMQEICVYIHQ